MTEWLLVLAAVALTAGTALFVTAEFSLVALDRPTVQQAIDNGDERAATVLVVPAAAVHPAVGRAGRDHPHDADRRVPRRTRRSAPAPRPAGLARALGQRRGSVATTLALVLVTLFSMVFGELMSQFLGISAPLAAAKVVAGPVRAFAMLARPMVAVLNGSANAAPSGDGHHPAGGAVRGSHPAGARQPGPDLGRGRAPSRPVPRGCSPASLDFGDRTAADVMTPRVRCSGIERTARAADVIRLARHTGHSRFPVIGDDWDDIDGLVHVKKAIAVPHDRRPDVPCQRPDGPAGDGSRDHPARPAAPPAAPPGCRWRRRRRVRRTSGVVTLEDVVEEIVGEVSDEHDRSQADRNQMADGSWTVPASGGRTRYATSSGPWSPTGRPTRPSAAGSWRRSGGCPSSVTRSSWTGGRPGSSTWTAAGSTGCGSSRHRGLRRGPAARRRGRRRGRALSHDGLSSRCSCWPPTPSSSAPSSPRCPRGVASSNRSPRRGTRAADGARRAAAHRPAARHGAAGHHRLLGLLGAMSEAALHHALVPVVRAPRGLRRRGRRWRSSSPSPSSCSSTWSGEMIPKNIAIARPERRRSSSSPLVMVSRIVAPVIHAMDWLAKAILRLFGVDPKDEVASAFTAEEVAHILDESRHEGLVGRRPLERLARPWSSATRTPPTSASRCPARHRDHRPRRRSTSSGSSPGTATPATPSSTTRAIWQGYLHLKDMLYADEEERASRCRPSGSPDGERPPGRRGRVGAPDDAGDRLPPGPGRRRRRRGRRGGLPRGRPRGARG